MVPGPSASATPRSLLERQNLGCPPQTSWMRVCIFTGPLDDSYTHRSLRRTGLAVLFLLFKKKQHNKTLAERNLQTGFIRSLIPLVQVRNKTLTHTSSRFISVSSSSTAVAAISHSWRALCSSASPITWISLHPQSLEETAGRLKQTASVLFTGAWQEAAEYWRATRQGEKLTFQPFYYGGHGINHCKSFC